MKRSSVTASPKVAFPESCPVLAHAQKGVTLIVSLVIIVLLTLIAVTSLRTSILEEKVSGNQRLAATALFAAERGVSEALNGLFDGTISTAGHESDPNWSHAGSVSGPGYAANYTVHYQLAGGDLIENDDGRTYFRITSDGETSSGEGRRMLEVAVAMEMGGEANVAGLIGCQGVTGLSNVVTGSYSSSGKPTDGDRGDIATTDSGSFLYLVGSSDFDVAGEIRSVGAIYLDSDALVRRDALANLRITVKSGDIYGSAYTNDTFYRCTSCVHGDIYQGPSVTPNPLVPYEECDPWDIDAIFSEAAAVKTSNHNAQIGRTSGGSYSGSPSTMGVNGASRDYYFSSFTLDGKSATINGDVRIYVYDDFTMKSNAQLILGAGASVKVYVETGNVWIDSNSMANHDPLDVFPNCTPGGCPIDLQIFSKRENMVKDRKVTSRYDEPDVWDDSQDVAAVKISSNAVFYGLIYAPRGHVVLYSNAQIYGSVRGRYVTTDSNMGFHYDEDLDSLWAGSPTDYKLVYWTELYPE